LLGALSFRFGFDSQRGHATPNSKVKELAQMRIEIHAESIVDFISKTDGSGILVVNVEDDLTKALVEDSGMILEANIEKLTKPSILFSFDTPEHPRTY
jgi:hypothetical protein